MFMKKLLIIFVSIALLVIGGLVYLSSQASSIVAGYKPQIEKAASEALKADVTLGALSAKAFPRISVLIEDVLVKPKNSVSKGFQLKNLALDVALFPLLTGKLQVSRLLINQPELRLTKHNNKISIEGLESSDDSPQAKEGNQTPSGGTGNTDKAASIPALPPGTSFALDEFRLEKASLTLTDKDTGKKVQVQEVTVATSATVSGSTLSLGKLTGNVRAADNFTLKFGSPSITLDIDSGAFEAQKVALVLLNGQVALNAKGNVKKQSIKFELDSPEALDLQGLQSLAPLAPALNEVKVSGQVRPRLNGELRGSELQAQGAITLSSLGVSKGALMISDLSGEIKLSSSNGTQQVASNGIGFLLGSAPLKADFEAALNSQELKLSKFNLAAFSGTVTASALLKQNTQSFESNFSVQNIKMEELSAGLAPQAPQIITGVLSNTSGQLRGILGEKMMESLNGTASFKLSDGTLKGVNLAGDVLRAVKNLPFLSGSLESGVPAESREAVSSPDTALKELSGDSIIAGGGLSTQNLKLLSTVFNLAARGRAGFDAVVDMQADILFDPAISAALIAKTKELQALRNAEERLVFPIAIQGKAPKLVVLPDLAKIITAATSGALREKATGALQKLLGGEKKKSGGLFGF